MQMTKEDLDAAYAENDPILGEYHAKVDAAYAKCEDKIEAAEAERKAECEAALNEYWAAEAEKRDAAKDELEVAK